MCLDPFTFILQSAQSIQQTEICALLASYAAPSGNSEQFIGPIFRGPDVQETSEKDCHSTLPKITDEHKYFYRDVSLKLCVFGRLVMKFIRRYLVTKVRNKLFVQATGGIL